MSPIVYVNSTHRLSRFYCFQSGLPISNDPVPTTLPSVEHIRWMLSLRQTGFLEAAWDLKYSNCDSHLCSNWAETRGCYLSAQWIVFAKELYTTILVDQLRKNDSPFKAAWDQVLSEMGQNSGPLQFVVISGEKENVWSCGLGLGAAKNTPHWEFRGRNLYGRILTRLAKGLPSTRWIVDNLFRHRHGDSTLWPFKRTVLVLSDSISRYIKHVEGGTLRIRSGAKFTDLLEVGEASLLQEHGLIIINGGVNVAQRPKATWNIQCQALRRLIRRACNLKPCPRVLLSGPIPLPGSRQVASFNEYLKEQIVTLGVTYIDWLAEDPPFNLDTRGDIEPQYVDRDGFHLSPHGTWKLIARWKEEYPLLEGIPFSVSRKMYPFDKRPVKNHPPYAGSRALTPVQN